jgi:hypothetical protein
MARIGRTRPGWIGAGRGLTVKPIPRERGLVLLGTAHKEPGPETSG